MIDLHTHTNNSDGSATVKELLTLAQKNGLEVLSITDHDSVGAYSELKNINIADYFDGRLITGVEITSMWRGELIEVLGYYIDTDKMSGLLEKNVRPLIDTIEDQSRIYMPAFLRYGVKFDPEFVDTITKTPEKVFENHKAYSQGVYLDQMRKCPDNAKFFASEEEFYNIHPKDFTRLFLYNPKSTLYVDLSELFLSAKKAIDFIHLCGGIALLAHPYVYSKTIVNSLDLLFEDCDFDGVECSYPTFTKPQSDFLYDYAKSHNLLTSCGSDFHGYDVKPDNILGQGTDGKILTAQDASIIYYK